MNIRKTIQTLFFKDKAQVFKFLIVGGSGVLLDLGLLYIFSHFWKIWPPFAVVLDQTCVLIYNFFLNKYWSFGSKKNGKQQFGRYLLLVGGNYLLSFLSMYVFHDILGADYLLVRILTIGVIFPLNFLCYKYWVYKEGYPLEESQNL